MTFVLNKIRKHQLHSDSLKTWNYRGSADFTDFFPENVLTGDNWRCEIYGEENFGGTVVNNIHNNVIIYKGDIVVALIDNPNDLTYESLNNNEWEIIRKSPIGYGEKITGIHGGTWFEWSITNDFLYLCVTAGVGETNTGDGDGTAVWKRIQIHKTGDLLTITTTPE